VAILYEDPMRMSMNTRFSGTARVDSTSVLRSGEVRWLMKLVNITEDVRKFAAEQGIKGRSGDQRKVTTEGNGVCRKRR
jgi:hypothetical protein